MGKAPDAFRTISEVADWLGVQTHVLRFWESKFTQIKPLKRAGGRRYYRPADMELLGGLRKLLHEDGLTIKGAQKFLRENGVKAVMAMSPPVEDTPQRDDAPSAPSGQEAAATMAPEAAMRPQPEGPDDAGERTGGRHSGGNRGAELHVLRTGRDAVAETAGSEAAPESNAGPAATAADMHGRSDDATATGDATGEQPAPAPEAAPPEAPSPAASEAQPQQEDTLPLPGFIRNPMPPEETGAPPAEPEAVEEAAFAGVGDPQMPDLTQMARQNDGPDAAPPAEQSGAGAEPAPVNFAVGVAPEPTMPAPTTPAPTPPVGLDAESLRPLYQRLIALRVRMG